MRFLLLLLCIANGIADAKLLRRQSSLGMGQWIWGQEADENQSLKVSIALTVQNAELGVETLLRISDPASPSYGQHLSAKEVAHIFKPKATVVFEVMKWLRGSGVDPNHVSFSHSGSYLSVDLPIPKAALLLQTAFYRQTHQLTGQERIDCQYYHIPESLAGSIDYVVTSSSVPTHRQTPRQQVVLMDEATTQEPPLTECFNFSHIPCLRELYEIPEHIPPHANNSFGIFQTSWFSWRPDDLDMFFKDVQPNLIGHRPRVDAINGGYLQRNLTQKLWYREPNLDFEYAMALTSPQEVTNIQVGSYASQGNIDDMLAAFDKYYCDPINPDYKKYPPFFPPGCNATNCDCGSSTPPKVLSISYGWTEADFTPNYLERQCLEFLKLGLMGTTVVVSVSDHGTASNRGSFCMDDRTGNATDGKFSPVFPASCPWVTSVGGTQLLHPDTLEKSTAATNETAFRKTIQGQLNTSGGGFSNVFPIPPYQVPNINSYKNIEKDHLSTIRDRFSHTGRGFPDVSARADSYRITLNGKWETTHGTSASAPVFASIITLINSERMHAGKGSVGFVNPVLYGSPDALNDVATGANEGCGVDEAFRAVRGWDAVTGLGSPSYERMRRLFMSLP